MNRKMRDWFKIVAVVAMLGACQAAVTVNQITGVTDQNLVFSGSIPISPTNSLFFTYYGVDGQKDQNALKNYPLLVVVGRYLSPHPVPAPPPSTTVSAASAPSRSTTTSASPPTPTASRTLPT